MRRGRDQGFTLLELIIAVIVIALVLAVAYPSISRGSTTIRLRTTGRDILNTFRYAREKAVTEQTAVRIVVDREKQELILSNDLGDGLRTYRLPDDVKIHRLALNGSEVMEGPLMLRFLPNGSTESAQVLLESKTGRHLEIYTDPITGGARIETGRGENQP